MEDLTDADNIDKDFEMKDLGEYNDFYIQSDTLLLAAVFENFRNVLIYTNLILKKQFQRLD